MCFTVDTRQDFSTTVNLRAQNKYGIGYINLYRRRTVISPRTRARFAVGSDSVRVTEFYFIFCKHRGKPHREARGGRKMNIKIYCINKKKYWLMISETRTVAAFLAAPDLLLDLPET